MPIIDLTHRITDGMAVYPGDPAVSLRPVLAFPHQPCRVSQLSFGSHTGTHMDAPAHMLEEGQTLDQYPVEGFCGAARVFSGDADFSQLDLSGLDFVLLDFHWAQRWGSPDFFHGYPALTAENARILASSGLKGVGMDTPSVDNEASGLALHHILLGSGLVLIESMGNLKRLPQSPVNLFALPLKWKGSDGAPCRAVAQWENAT